MLHLSMVYAIFYYGMVYTIINLFAPFGTPQINDNHFKYILASGRDLMLTSVAHLRKKAELNVVGVLEVSRGKCASLYTGSNV